TPIITAHALSLSHVQMDTGFYKRGGRGAAIKHKTAAMPFYTRSPAVAPAAPSAGGKAKVLAAAPPWPAPSPPPPSSSVVAVEVVISGSGGGGCGDADVDRRAAMYISRVQERLRRERAMGDDVWRKCY
ncbi:hypothetical protein ABZP36_007257, partial [Zizania latifolia]